MRRLRDIDGLVADAFEVVVDARHRQHQPQVHSHQLMERQELHDADVNLDLQFVDDVFFFQDGFGQFGLGVQHRMDRAVHGALGQGAHPQ